MERLPNYDNFQQLWDYHTTVGGMNPVQAAGYLANIYAESRGNPGAINPGDGSDGSDSVGLLQANAGRASALRDFAAQRQKTADDLLTNAAFHLMEGRVGSEKKGFAQGMAGQTPEEAALGFASGFIRPAAQHIPERAGYGRMMYDIFAGGNPNGVQPGLAFNPEQGERQSRALEEQEANGGPKLGFSNTGNQDIVAQLLGMAQQPMDATISPMEGPRSGLAQDQPPQVGGAAGPRPQTTSPQLGEAPDYDAQVDEMFPAPEGQPSTVKLIEKELLVPVAEAAAYNLGVPVEDAPTTPSAIAAAAAEPMPDPADTSEEADKARKKRMLASDMLAVLSVGLGQMSSGQGVNVGEILQGQNARRFKEGEQQAEQQAQQAALAQQRQLASTVAQEFTAMNMTGMAKIAMSGEAGLKQALSTMGTIKGQTPATKDGFEALPEEERKALLRRAGMSEQEVEIYSSPGMAAEAADAITEGLKGQGLKAESAALIDAALPFMAGNPAMSAAVRRLAANLGSENAIKAVQDALVEAGGDLPSAPMSEGLVRSLAKTAGLELDDGLVQQALAGNANAQAILEEAAAEGAKNRARVAGGLSAEAGDRSAAADILVETGALSPTLAELYVENPQLAMDLRDEGIDAAAAARAEDAVLSYKSGLSELYPQEEAQQLIASITDKDSVKEVGLALRDKFGVPANIQSLKAMMADPQMRTFAMELAWAEAGITMAPEQKQALLSKVTALSEQEAALARQEKIVRSMKDVKAIAMQGDPVEGGFMSGKVFEPAQRLLTDLFGEGAQGMLAGTDDEISSRMLKSFQGRYFGDASSEVKGALSDKDVELILEGFPGVADNNIKRALIAQAMIRDYDAAKMSNGLRQEYILDQSIPVNDRLSVAKQDAYVAGKMETLSKDNLPKLNLTEEGYEDNLLQQMDSGNMSPDTVIYAVDAEGPKFLYAKDLYVQVFGEEKAARLMRELN
jgi:hypothetical protein